MDRKTAMAEPRIWFDPPAFSWGRVLRIGLLWSAAVLMLLVPIFLTVEDDRPAPAAVEPAALLVQQPAGALPAASQAPVTAVAARVASSPAGVASAPAIAR